MKGPITDLAVIKTVADQNEAENDAFYYYLKQTDNRQTDEKVHALNEFVSSQVDCTSCGNCCRSLMINVTKEETALLATRLKMEPEQVKEKYIEESEGGKLIMNTIPCNFLSNNICTIYEDRFKECRDFPHLFKPNFTRRFPATLMYYAMCPIIFNVVEALKTKLGFKIETIHQVT